MKNPAIMLAASCVFTLLCFFVLPTTGLGQNDFLDEHLSLYLPFDNSAVDESGNNTTVTSGGITYATDRFGRANSALDVDPLLSSQVAATLPENLISPTTSNTITFWVNVSQWASTHNHIFQFRHECLKYQQTLAVSPTNFGPSYGASCSYAVYGTVFQPVSLNTWYHISLSWNGDVLRVYVNGKLSGVSDPLGFDPLVGGNKLTIHGANKSIELFDGLVDDFRIYDVALSAEQVGELYAYESELDSDGDGVPDDEDLFPNDPFRSTVFDHMDFMCTYILDPNVIQDSDWKNQNNRRTFCKNIDVVYKIALEASLAAIPEEASLLYLEAAMKVEDDLMPKTDGFQIGGSFKQDWIVTKAAQDLVYPDLVILRDILLELAL